MGFMAGLSMTFLKHNAIYIIVDWLTKSAHLILVKTNFPLAKLSILYIKEVVKFHGIPYSVMLDIDPWFISRFWISL